MPRVNFNLLLHLDICIESNEKKLLPIGCTRPRSFNRETRHPAWGCIDDILRGMTLATNVKPEDLDDRPPISDEMDSPLLFAIGIE